MRYRPEEMEKGSKIPQFLAVIVANLCVFATGAVEGWTSPILPKLEKDGGPLGSPISKEQSSWIVSLVAVGAFVGSFVVGYLADRWGRKRTMLFSVVPLLIGWILVITAGNVIQLYVARFILGLAFSISFTIVPMYCGEIAETSIRGTLGSFFMLFVMIGFLYDFSIGPFVSYVVFGILCAIVAVIFFVSFIFMPESPYFLLNKGYRDDAIASLVKLRGKSEAAVQEEADEIQLTLEKTSKNQVSIWDLFQVKVNFKALMYTCAAVTFQQLTGVFFVVFYMHSIFDAAGGLVPMEIAPIVVAVAQVLASLVTPMVVDRSGRRILLAFSSFGEAVSLCALGVYFYLKEVQHADDVVEQISWLPVVALIIFTLMYSLGSGPVPWILMGEMFASNVKAKASSITVFVCWFWAFIISKFSNNLEEVCNGKYGVFWLFSAFSFISVIFTVLLLPETKNKTFQQIQDELNGVHLRVNVKN